jgi:hypothetical protein
MTRIARIWMAALTACAGAQESAPTEPNQESAAVTLRKDLAPGCSPDPARPRPGQAAVAEEPEGDGVRIHYAATPAGAPCEALDIRLELRHGMLVGEPGRQVEMSWAAEGAVADGQSMSLVVGQSMSLLVGGAPVATGSEAEQRGSHIQVSARVAAELLLSFAVEEPPTLVVAGRRVELSRLQIHHLHRVIARLPIYRRAGGPRASRGPSRPAPASAPVARDPDAGRGWYCVEAQAPAAASKRTSACHRTAAECEASRAAIQAAERRVGPCTSEAAAICYDWRASGEARRSCFHRPSQCDRDQSRREEADSSKAHTTGCYRSE